MRELLMHILDLLDMNFDAAVVFVTKFFSYYSDWLEPFLTAHVN